MSRLRVLQSFSRPSDEDNPYIALTVASIDPIADSSYFSWRTAILGRYDVLHLHWLDPFVYGSNRRSMVQHWLGSLLLLARLSLTRVAVVRTLHNKSIRGGERQHLAGFIVRQLERRTVLTIVMNRQLEVEDSRRRTLVPHGHYRPWFEDHEVPPSVAGRLLTFGLLRGYKGIDVLLDAFEGTKDLTSSTTLHVVGKVVDVAVGDAVAEAARQDCRLVFRPGHATDEQLAAEIGESEIVVLPYEDLFNSGCVLLALSMDRPVLVPECGAASELLEEFGPDWLITFAPPLDGVKLAAALASASSSGRTGRPDLSSREWPTVGAATVEAYRAAVAVRTSR